MSEKIQFPKRFASFIIDILIILVLTISIGYPIGTSIRNVESQNSITEISKNEPDSTLPMTAEFGTPSKLDITRFGFEFGFGLFGILYGLIEAFGAASPGKMIVNLRIFKDDKTQLTHSILFLRYLIKNLTFILFLIAGIWYLPTFERAAILGALILFIGMFRAMTDDGKTLLDYIFKTAVYDKKLMTSQQEILTNND